MNPSRVWREEGNRQDKHDEDDLQDQLMESRDTRIWLPSMNCSYASRFTHLLHTQSAISRGQFFMFFTKRRRLLRANHCPEGLCDTHNPLGIDTVWMNWLSIMEVRSNALLCVEDLAERKVSSRRQHHLGINQPSCTSCPQIPSTSSYHFPAFDSWFLMLLFIWLPECWCSLGYPTGSMP